MKLLSGVIAGASLDYSVGSRGEYFESDKNSESSNPIRYLLKTFQ